MEILASTPFGRWTSIIQFTTTDKDKVTHGSRTPAFHEGKEMSITFKTDTNKSDKRQMVINRKTNLIMEQVVADVVWNFEFLLMMSKNTKFSITGKFHLKM